MIRLIPQPLSVTENTGAFVKASDFTVTRKTLSVKQCDESYSLYIKADGITICASSEKGFFYAEKTLEQIISFYGDLIPVCTVNDSPRFEYRGFMIDWSAAVLTPIACKENFGSRISMVTVSTVG